MQPLEAVVPGLHSILDLMVHVDPAHRITMADASARFQTFMTDVSEETLQLPMWQYRP